MVGCPIDHEDNSKRWCSTKVDSNGNHIANQNEFGYCADDCPTSNGEDIIIDETTENPILEDTNSTGISTICLHFPHKYGPKHKFFHIFRKMVWICLLQ